MNSNLQKNKIDFLRNKYLFELFSEEELLKISNEITISYINKNEYFFKTKDNLSNNFFVVYSGLIGLYAISNANELLIDQCFIGSTFGLRPHFAKNVYQLTARAHEDSVIIEIPFAFFQEILTNNKIALNYVMRCLASNKRNPNNELNPGFLVSQNVLNSIHNNTFDFFQQIKYNSNFNSASPLTLVSEIIELMRKNNLSCTIIEENENPVGIITDVNLRNNIHKIILNNKILAKDIMTFPVITAAETISLPEAQLIFLENPINHICITKNGFTNSKTIGLVSIQEVISSAVDNPNTIIQQIKTAKDLNYLKEIRLKINQFIDNISNLKIPYKHTSKILGEFNDLIIKKVIVLTLENEETSPPTPFSWFSMGSIARHEQILLTDQNSGLVFLYEKEHDRNYTEIRNYFLKFADKVIKTLNTMGYNYCQENNMANNLNCCKSLNEWNTMYQDWLFNTKNILSDIKPIFFDTHFIFGNENLYNQLTINSITIDYKKEDLFLSYLGKKALEYPTPLGFFNQFITEDNEEEKDEFNIKLRAIQPLVDAARVLLLRKNETTIKNTIKRYSKLIELDPKNKLVYEDCIESFIIFQEFRTLEGLKDQNDGNFVAIDKLSKSDQNKLKQSLESLQNIQEIIKDKFNFNYFN